jgi:hypothetical protein
VLGIRGGEPGTGDQGSGPVGFLATVALCAVSTGLAVVTTTVLLVDSLRSGGESGNFDLRLYLLFGGTASGVLLAAVAAWRLLGPIASSYRRGGLAMVCAFATVLLMLICIPINQLLGRAGLLGLLGLCGVVALVLARRVRRSGVHA